MYKQPKRIFIAENVFLVRSGDETVGNTRNLPPAFRTAANLNSDLMVDCEAGRSPVSAWQFVQHDEHFILLFVQIFEHFMHKYVQCDEHLNVVLFTICICAQKATHFVTLGK